MEGGNVSAAFTVSGGQPPYTWNIPDVQGLSLTQSSGPSTTITGTAANVGSFPFIVTVSDTSGQVKTNRAP